MMRRPRAATAKVPSTDGRLRDCGGVECLGRGCRAFGSASPERKLLYARSLFVALYHTHMGVMPGGRMMSCSLAVLLCFGASSGMREVRRSSIALFNTLTKQTQTLCVSCRCSLSHSHTPVPKRFLFISTRQVRQLARPCPRRKRACTARLNLRSRLAATAAGQVPRIDDSPSDEPCPACLFHHPNLSAPTPARGLPTPPRP